METGTLTRRRVLTAMLIVALGSVGAACDGGADGTSEDGEADGSSTVVTVTPTASVSLVDDEGRFFSISEVGFGRDGYVMLTNFTEVPANLAGLYLCGQSACVELPDTEVGGEKAAAVAVGDEAGLDDVVLSDAAIDLPAEDGEVGLYASEDVEEPADVRAYVEWGSSPHPGSEAAVESGLWIEGSFVESAPDAKRIRLSAEAGWEAE